MLLFLIYLLSFRKNQKRKNREVEGSGQAKSSTNQSKGESPISLNRLSMKSQKWKGL